MTDSWLKAKKAQGAGEYKVLVTDDIGDSNLSDAGVYPAGGITVTVPAMEKVVWAIPHIISSLFYAQCTMASGNAFKVMIMQIELSGPVLAVSGEKISNVLNIGAIVVGE